MGSEPPGFKTEPNPTPVGALWMLRPVGKFAGHDYEWLDHNRMPVCNANERLLLALPRRWPKGSNLHVSGRSDGVRNFSA
jgi:hypothetical protein